MLIRQRAEPSPACRQAGATHSRTLAEFDSVINDRQGQGGLFVEHVNLVKEVL